MLSQAKIDLAVLLKLFQHAEAHGEAITPREICDLFEVSIPVQRVCAALEKLQTQSEVVQQYDRFHEDDGLWQIGREGILTVERAIRAPSTFIARLELNGDRWLESDEASSAVLNKAKRQSAYDPAKLFYDEALDTNPATTQPVQITNNFMPSNTVSATPANSTNLGDRSGWWNFGAAIIIGIVTIAVTLWVSGKL